jgi:hypothetical protein
MERPMFDHTLINAAYQDRSPDAAVFPVIVMTPAAGDVRFYERTAHLSGSQRYAAAVRLRDTMRAWCEEPVMGGDEWIKSTRSADQ